MFASPALTWRELEQLRMLRAREMRRTRTWAAGFRFAAWLTRRGASSRTVFLAGLVFRALATVEASARREWSRWGDLCRGLDAVADMIPPGPGYVALLLGLLTFCALAVVIRGGM